MIISYLCEADVGWEAVLVVGGDLNPRNAQHHSLRVILLLLLLPPVTNTLIPNCITIVTDATSPQSSPAPGARSPRCPRSPARRRPGGGRDRPAESRTPAPGQGHPEAGGQKLSWWWVSCLRTCVRSRIVRAVSTPCAKLERRLQVALTQAGASSCRYCRYSRYSRYYRYIIYKTEEHVNVKRCVSWI